jgi:HK97 family phage major capsid protein
MKKYKFQHERLNELMTRADEIKGFMETRELTDAEAQELAEIRDDVKAIKDALGIAEEIGDEREETSGEETEERAEDEVAQFDRYIRSMALDKRGDDVNLTKGDNGDIIPTTIANKIIEKLYAICPILERADVYNVKGNLSIPFYDESSHAITVGYANEFEELTSSVGNFDTVDLKGFLAGALVKISKSLINNVDFNLTDYIVNRMAYSFKRWVEGECLHGTSQKITGLTDATLSVTASAQTAITADEVIQLHDKIIDDYQGNAIFIMNPATRTALRTLKGSDGHYLLNDDITSEFDSTLLGKPVYVTDNMEAMGAGKVAIYYGDMSGLAVKFAEQIDVQVLVERFATQHAVGVVGWAEVDAKVEDLQKVAKLVMASA